LQAVNVNAAAAIINNFFISIVVDLKINIYATALVSFAAVSKK